MKADFPEKLAALIKRVGCCKPESKDPMVALGQVFGFCDCSGVFLDSGLLYLLEALWTVNTKSGIGDRGQGEFAFLCYQLSAMKLTNHGHAMPGYLTKQGLAALEALNSFFGNDK